MAAKPETSFIQSIHRLLPVVHHEKMNNPFLSGTADVWYSGMNGDLWVEYKFIAKIPRSENIFPDLTPRQTRWLDNRCDEGRNVAVVLGTPTGGVIYRDKQWSVPLDTAGFTSLLVPKREIADWIFQQVGAGICR